MDYEQLRDTVMNPESRTLRRIIVEDIEKANDAFRVCMGSAVEPRREFIENNAYKVDLDLD